MKNLNKNWINLLTENQLDKQLEFKKILCNSKSELLAIMKYRRLLFQSGRGQDITLDDLLVGQIKEESYLVEVLQQLFLEPLEVAHIEYLYKKAYEKYDNMFHALKALYEKRKEDQCKRFLSVVLSI